MRSFLLYFSAAVLSNILVTGPALGQDSGGQMDMPGMDMAHEENMPKSGSMIDDIEMHSISGTDLEPSSAPSEMLMHKFRGWTLMFHGEAFLNEIQQSGPRGADKLFASNWLMPMAQRKIGRGTLTLKTMLSLEPATVTKERYPELFQQGETAYGLPIVDGQHPHDFFMELAAMFDYKLNENSMLSIYAAPVGDPALGPPAYPHRATASEDPIAPLGHHLQDSTHIASDVVTAGFTYRHFRLEASGFHGREPNQYRWDIDSAKIDSWSARLTVNPSQDWSIQYSIGQLQSPEALSPNQTVRRMTASVIYNRRLRKGNWASMVLWGRNQALQDGNVGNAYLFESTLQFLTRNSVWARLENVDRTNELLLGEVPLPPTFAERYFTRIQAYTAGYDREIGSFSHLSAALGAQITLYGVPAVLKPIYDSPVGGVVFLCLRIQ